MKKRFALSAQQIEELVPAMGWCIATDRITVDSKPVGYLYREPPDDADDSGWRFFAGDETEEYADDSNNSMLYDVNTIANYDRSIIPLLETEAPCAFERSPDGKLIEIDASFLSEPD